MPLRILHRWDCRQICSLALYIYILPQQCAATAAKAILLYAVIVVLLGKLYIYSIYILQYSVYTWTADWIFSVCYTWLSPAPPLRWPAIKSNWIALRLSFFSLASARTRAIYSRAFTIFCFPLPPQPSAFFTYRFRRQPCYSTGINITCFACKWAFELNFWFCMLILKIFAFYFLLLAWTRNSLHVAYENLVVFTSEWKII